MFNFLNFLNKKPKMTDETKKLEERINVLERQLFLLRVKPKFKEGDIVCYNYSSSGNYRILSLTKDSPIQSDYHESHKSEWGRYVHQYNIQSEKDSSDIQVMKENYLCLIERKTKKNVRRKK